MRVQTPTEVYEEKLLLDNGLSRARIREIDSKVAHWNQQNAPRAPDWSVREIREIAGITAGNVS